MKATLTADEKAQLTRLEAVVEAGVKVTLPLIEAGKALAEIRKRQLYRDSAGGSWSEYVQARFRITRRRADQLIAFAGIQEALEETGNPVPVLSEKAARPLVSLDPATVADVVKEAAASPDGVTPETIRKAAAKRKPKAKAARPVRFKVPGWVIVATPNRKATGTVLDALASAMRQIEAADKAKATEAA